MCTEHLDTLLLLEMMYDDSNVDDIFELHTCSPTDDDVEDYDVICNYLCNVRSVSQSKRGGSRPGRSSDLRRTEYGKRRQ